MSPSKHHCTEDKLTPCAPCPREAIRLIRQADRDTNAAIRTYGLKNNIENAENSRIALKAASLKTHNEEDGENDSPYVVGELGAQLMAHKVLSGCIEWRPSFEETAEESFLGGLLLVAVLWVVGVDSKTAFFVDICVTHGDDDGIDGDVPLRY